MDLDKCIVMCCYQYITQHSCAALKILFALPIHLSEFLVDLPVEGSLIISSDYGVME